LADAGQTQVGDAIGVFLAGLAHIKGRYTEALEIRDVAAVAWVLTLLHFAANIVHAEVAFALSRAPAGFA
jgi:hypothetical protein